MIDCDIAAWVFSVCVEACVGAEALNIYGSEYCRIE